MSKKFEPIQNGLIITGGGTGGHVLAGIAIADAWRNIHNSGTPILFVGTKGGMEEQLVPKAGYPLHLLSLGSLNRVGIKKQMKTLLQLPGALISSARVLLKVRPDYVVGVGGYASGPLILMARILKNLNLIKPRIAILEQNSLPGITNRILSHFVDLVFAAFPGTEKRFSRNRVILTGNPIRSSMKTLPSAKRHPFTVLIFGGSQGAIGINSLVIEALNFFTDPAVKDQFQWIHQTGVKDFARVQAAYERHGISARVEKFIDTMPAAYAEASLLICRAGSSTLAEVATVGRCAIFIPLPTASDNHQEFNAAVFADAGAGYIVRQPGTTGSDLAALIQKLRHNPLELESVEKAVQRFAAPDAAQRLVRELGGA